MAFWGCEKCGVALNAQELSPVLRRGRLERLCPECGRGLEPVSLTEALELVRERAEADRWRSVLREEPPGERAAAGD
jgi:hypothetical protein